MDDRKKTEPIVEINVRIEALTERVAMLSKQRGTFNRVRQMRSEILALKAKRDRLVDQLAAERGQ